ncbi:hypothetical protein IL306_006320 [Fusarium sp. DS 682]|nr:hypothetical protein IL306_006320 [Fusarium sp. DS 682]
MASQNPLPGEASPTFPPLTSQRTPSNDLPKDLIEYHSLYSKHGDIPAVSSFDLDPACYQDNEDRLRNLFGKFDFYPVPGKIVIWMPSVRHSRFTKGVESHIEKQLEAIKDTLPGHIDSEGDGDVSLKNESQLQPNASFRYIGDDGHGKAPSLIIEVANSQSYKSLMSKTKKYLTKTRGEVKTVICFDIQYVKKPLQDSTVSV